MPEFRINKRDLEFVLFEQFGVDKFGTIFDKYEGMTREDFAIIIDEAIRFAVEKLAPTNQPADTEGCRLENGQVYVPESYINLYKQYGEGGWIAPAHNPEYGGMGLPLPLSMAITEIGIGAASSFVFYPGLTVAAGHLLEVFGERELRELLVPKLYGGEWTGTMCLTEPHAGTAVGDIKSTATPIEGTNEYSIVGNKIFISAGDHQLTDNIVHLVLARAEGDPAGIKGISLFAVPKKRFDATGAITGPNDVAVTAIEHKMGINGSSTCSLAFGDNKDCRGYLIGERCKGIVYMFQMMNEARIVCGLQGVALASTAYESALSYAKERVQGTKVTDRSPDAPQVTIIDHPDVRRNLMIAKSIGEGARAMILQASLYSDGARFSNDEASRERYQQLLDFLTPVCKAYPTDMGFKAAEVAVQVHGGYGYVTEYLVEGYLRDAKIASIYEGTNGVQALDLLGRKMRVGRGALFMTWLDEVGKTIAPFKGHERLGDIHDAVVKAQNTVTGTAMHLGMTGRQDINLALLSATPFLEMIGHIETARLFLAQAGVADAKLQSIVGDDDASQVVRKNEEARFYDAKVKTARFFSQHFLPQVRTLGETIMANHRTALDIVF